MATYSYPPYVNANLATFLKWKGPSTGFPEGEYWQFLLIGRSGRVFQYSPVLRDVDANRFVARYPFRLQKGDYVEVIHFWVQGHLIFKGSARYLIHPWQSVWIKNPNSLIPGLTTKVPGVSLIGRTLSRGTVGRKAQRLSLVQRTAARGVVQSKVSSNLRPSPEIRSQTIVTVVGNKASFAAPWTESLGSVSSQTYRRAWTGVRTPGYGSKKGRQLPVNPHTVDLRTTFDGPYIRSGKNSHPTSGAESCTVNRYTLHYSGATLPVHNALATNIAVKRLVAAAGTGIDANIAQDFAQIGQTVTLIGGTLKRLTRSITALRRGNLSEAANTLFLSARHTYRRKGGLSKSKSLAENWLELQYGWKPLLNDVYGVMKSLSFLQTKGDRVTRTKASATVRSEVVTKIPDWAFGTQAYVGVRTVRTATTCRLMVKWKIDDYLKAFLAQTGFTNPVNLAWEILPFSFVFDWFLPIGPYLETLSSWDGLAFMEGSQVQFTRQWTESVVDSEFVNPANPPWSTVKTLGHYVDQWILLNRVKLTTFPSSTVPSLKNGMASVDHALNALALFRVLVR